ncbi:MAG: 2-C-methyl-D-erythritol 4-phosphate cytidylyltransferase [Candidatus Omnitrophica bacterium]|nr:2-C-methyl-D-erythritol 4-phosphate cytidylyltransferase [Candidatus Omnitrophota bacterium]
MKTAVIIPAAGTGSRLSSKVDKPFVKLCEKEIILYCLRSLEDSPLISEVIIASRPKNIPKLKKLVKREGIKKIKAIVKGEKTRALSVRNGLDNVSADTRFVIIHDCARPFLTQGLIKETLKAAKAYGASLAAVAVKPTIKESGTGVSFVKRTIDRRLLWEAQTPQAFKKELLVKAYKRFKGSCAGFTDDTSLVEKMGQRVKIVKGSYNNIKITTPEDLLIAEAILKRVK